MILDNVSDAPHIAIIFAISKGERLCTPWLTGLVVGKHTPFYFVGVTEHTWGSEAEIVDVLGEPPDGTHWSGFWLRYVGRWWTASCKIWLRKQIVKLEESKEDD